MIMGVNRCHLINITANFKFKRARVRGSFFAVNKGVFVASNSALPCF